MTGSRQAPDRSRQKARTRQAILDAAVAMLRQGRQPTVAEAAEAAGVHRATAYRYFPTPRSLLVDAWLTARAPQPADLYRGVPADDPVALMDTGVRGVADYMFRDEAMFRSIVQVTLERWFASDNGHDTDPVPVRETRRYSFIDLALAPLEGMVPEPELRRLRHALTLVFGAEALIVMRDVARLDPAQATDVMRWAAATLITGAIAQASAHHQPPGTDRETDRVTSPDPAQPGGLPAKMPQ